MDLLITVHGPHASWKPTLTSTVAGGVGWSMDATFNVGTMSYTGPAKDIPHNC
jgi:hypothetical protein